VREQRVGSTRTLLGRDDGGLVRRTVLPGGLRVISEQVPGVRSVAFGVWVGVGSRDETAAQTGSAHYLEHLLFKGTERRSALEISAATDAVGGELNAFTTKEYTCFYARVLDADLPLAVDVVSDVVTSAVLRTSDIDNERGVILEEIAMHDDDPDDCVHDAAAEQMFGDTPLGRSILGSSGSIHSITPRAIRAFYRRHYRAENIVVAAAGNLEHATLVRLVRKAFARLTSDDIESMTRPARVAGRLDTFLPINLLTRPTEQANLVLALPGPERTDPRRYALGVLNSALGGGMSSRLFQEIREKRGLAYSVYSFSSAYADVGMIGVYAGCLPRKVGQVLELCRTELDRVREHGITAAELERGKGQLRGSFVLGLEDTSSRMSRVAKAELLYDELPSFAEVLRRIEAVTLADIAGLAEELLAPEPRLTLVGPFDDAAEFVA
jgi:predicted Zn-dependent peptidase